MKMEYNKRGQPVVRSLKDMDEAGTYMYVSAICPKCGHAWTSLRANARQVLEKGCLACADGAWEPTVLVQVTKR